MKTCRKCGETKTLEFFSKHVTCKDGYRNHCKSCRNIQAKEYRAKKSTKIKIKEYRAKNKEKLKKYRYEYYQKNKKIEKDRKKRWYYENREEILVKKQKWYNKNQQRELERGKIYREKNRKVINQKRKERYWNNRNKELAYKKKPETKAKHKIWYNKNKEVLNKKAVKRREDNKILSFTQKTRNLINQSFRKKGWDKNSNTQFILGCDYIFLKKYLEKTFVKNYGIPVEQAVEKIHIDHIIPLSTAKTEEEVIKLNHYTNLQYLYESHNLQKSNKLDWKLEDAI